MSNASDHLSLIVTADAPSAIGPYSQGIVYGDLIFTAGQIPLEPETMTVVDGGIEAQAERVMANLAGVVTAAGSTLTQVIKTTCFLADLDDFPTFNAVYARWFGDHKPARSTVQVARLPLGVLVEVECIARRGEASPPDAVSR